MFSAGFQHKAMVINTINVRRIDFRNIEELRNIVIQVLRNPCNKVILDINGVNFIDSTAFSIINELIQLANKRDTIFLFANVDIEVKELFELSETSRQYQIDEQLSYSTDKKVEFVA